MKKYMLCTLTCCVCKKEFLRAENRITANTDYCCSKICTIELMKIRRKEKWEDVETLFYEKINKTPGLGSNGDCWEWTGTINPTNGYGYMMVHYKQNRVHRLSYEIFKGDIPKDLVVMHKCDNKICVNPEHLELGTSKKNSEDSALRGLHQRGEKRYNAKLTEKQVREIRIKWNTNKYKQKELGKEYGVSQYLIYAIVNRKRWKHVD